MASLEGVSLEFTAGFTAGDRTLLSSVGGFSQPNKRQIRSLQELLGTIRPLGLEFVQGHTLQEQKWLGEGVSYKVFKCLQRSTGKVVAVKQIKLPSASSQEAFDRQVACVLRDIEVMSHGPLAGHENVLNILGYGWNFRGSGSIPFLVTEYASSGTLRDYLRRYKLPSRDRLLMCVNVARGLHELHLCGMAHGDLKLDNVLVTPHTSAQSGPQGLSQSVVAKISDFGHSLLLYEDDDAKEDQKYGGTLAYNAPEIARSHGLEYETLNFRKCDVWSLGLLCWEALDHGSPYYKSSRIQDLIAFTKTDSRSTSDHSASASKGSTSTSKGPLSTTESILGSLSTLSSRLQEVATEFLDSETVGDLYSFEKGKLRELFQATLDVDPDKRVADIPMLPLLLKNKSGTERSRLGQSSGKSAEWSFEVFRPAQVAQFPYVVKAQILNDCRRLGSEAGRSIASAKAAFHVSLAYLLGFGTDIDTDQALEWATKSCYKGSPNAETLRELITETYINDCTSSPLESHQRYTRIIRDAFRKLDIDYLDAIPSTTTLTYAELKQIADDHARENLVNDTPTLFYLAHYAVRHGLTKYLSKEDAINVQSHSSGETPLALACRLGDIRAVHDLTNVGADRYIASYDGSFPIHFLCMFPPEFMKLAAFLLLREYVDDYPPSRTASITSSMVKQEKQETMPTTKFAVVKYEFHPKNDNELGLVVDEIIVVEEAVDEEWWKGTNVKGENGVFPRMFVEMVGGDEPEAAIVPDSPSRTDNEIGEDHVPETSKAITAGSITSASLTPRSKEETAKTPAAKISTFPTFEDQTDANEWFIRSAGSRGGGHVDSIATKPRYLDRQLPLQLIGTPLAYAVAIASQDAVEILLHLGAAPTNGPRTELRNSNPIHLATSLHLVNILDLLLVKAKARMTPDNLIIANDIDACLTSAWRPLAETSMVERTFIHGRHMQSAITGIVTLLRGRMDASYSRPILTTKALITSSIEMGDISIASAGLPLPERCEDGTLESRISIWNRNLLMLMCTRAACSGCFDTPKCYELLEFALSCGSHLDCDLLGISGAFVLGDISWQEQQRPINIAIEFHRAEILDWFIHKGGSLNVKDGKGLYPLHHLIRSGFSRTYSIKKLLEAGANPNALAGLDAETGDTALQLAIKYNKPDEVSLLLQGGADPMFLCDGGDQLLTSALHCAVRTGNLNIVTLLLKGASKKAMSPAIESRNVSQRAELLSQKDGAGNTPLLVASTTGNVEIVSFLLEVGADLSAVDYGGFNCMHIAASQRHETLLTIFAEKMDVNSKIVQSGSTALHLVSSALKKVPDAASKCCFVLVKAGADPKIENRLGVTSLYNICSLFSGSDDEQHHQIRRSLLDMMVKRGINLDLPSNRWQTCIIHEAISSNDVIFVQDLLELGASVDILDKKGWTPLKRCATIHGRGSSFIKPTAMLANTCKIADMLIDKGADIYVVDGHGNDLLVTAVLSGSAPMVHLLLEHFERGIKRSIPKPGNVVNKLAVETPPASISSVPLTKASKRESFSARFKQIIKKGASAAPISEDSRLKGKEMAEDRLQNIGIIDREIILGAWQTAVLSAQWDCVSAFIDRDVHGDTDPLKFPVGIGLLKYALETEISPVLKNFMGCHQHMVCDTLVRAHEPDPILSDIWTRVTKRTERQQGKDIGIHTLRRAAQLIEARGFTPLLDLPSLIEKKFIEGGYDTRDGSLKQAYMTESDTKVEPPVVALFDEEEDGETPLVDFDEEIQLQLNSLFGSMRRKIGIINPDDA